MQTFDFDEFLIKRTDVGDEYELDSVLDKLPPLSDGIWIAGGAVRRTIQGLALSTDIDLFFRNEVLEKDFEKALVDDCGAVLVNKSDNQKTYDLKIDDDTYKIQLVIMDYYNTVEILLDSFDFTISQFALDHKGKMYCGDYSLWDLARKRLSIHKLTYGVATTRRLIKYSKQGFYACSGCLTDLLNRVAEKPEVINSTVQYVD